jgi:hypothetical protein
MADASTPAWRSPSSTTEVKSPPSKAWRQAIPCIRYKLRSSSTTPFSVAIARPVSCAPPWQCMLREVDQGAASHATPGVRRLGARRAVRRVQRALTGRAQRIGDALRQSGIAPDISADIKGRAVGQDSFLLITGIGGVTALARSAIGPSSRARRAAFFSERHARKSSRARKPPKPHTFKQPISMPCSRGRRTRDAMAILDGTRSRRLPPSRGRRAERRCHPSRKSSTASRRRSARRSWRARRCTSHPDRRRRKHPRHRPFRPERETSMGSQMPQPPDRRRNWQREAATGPFAHDGAHVTITARRRERQSPRRGAGASHRYSRRSILSPPYSCLASGVLTRCSPTNHTCISLVRITSETSRSLVPSSPASAAWRAIARASFRTISCA